jgi:heme/copper-type cytochrome/quinol oxidase subunit 3
MASDGSSDVDGYGDGSGPREASFANLQTVGMVLFLAALFMLFVAGLVGFVWIRLANEKKAPAGTIHLPVELWLSTVLVIGVSIALSRANTQIRLGKQRSLRNRLTAALALAIGFLTVQTPAMIQLLSEHEQFRSSGMHLYGFIFFLVLLHAMHVVGGMVALIFVTIKAQRGGYEGESTSAIRNTTLYWHFLDVVWIVMFAILFLLR